MRNVRMTGLAIAVLAALAACGNKPKTEAVEPKPTPAASSDSKIAPAVVDTKAEKPAVTPEKPAELQHIIYFEFDSSVLSDEARKALEENYDWLKENQARTLTIEGHTDEVGTNEYNLGLGDRRARAAMDYLIRLGIDAKRLHVITYGEERPASTQDDENRRSVFVATKK